MASKSPEDTSVDENVVQEILHELFSSLEAMETQSAAILQLVKEKGLASEEELARYLEQAGNASNVRWRAARVRIEHLISGALKTAEREAKPETSKPEVTEPEEKSEKSSADAGEKKSQAGQQQKEVSKTQDDSGEPPQGSGTETGTEKSEIQAAKATEDDSAKQNRAEAPRENDRQNAA